MKGLGSHSPAWTACGSVLTFHPPADLALGTLSSHFPGYPARKCRREEFNPDLISLPTPPHPTPLWQEGRREVEDRLGQRLQ